MKIRSTLKQICREMTITLMGTWVLVGLNCALMEIGILFVKISGQKLKHQWLAIKWVLQDMVNNSEHAPPI